MNFQSNPLISLEIDGEVYDYKLYESLKSLNKTSSQRKSAKELGISHTVFNRRLLRAEEKLGFKLTIPHARGSVLSPEAQNLLEEFRKYIIQLQKTPDINIAGGHISTGLLESIGADFNLNIYSSSDMDAFKLARRGAVDILTLDDPLIAYERDINFIPIAYDYLVLVSGTGSAGVESISDLENLEFVEVKGSAQRLAWSSLKHYDIEYNIHASVNSQFDAFKMVRNSDNLHTFLNASYFTGNELLKYDTRHVISVVKVSDDKEGVDEYIRFLLNDAQKQIAEQGFKSMSD